MTSRTTPLPTGRSHSPQAVLRLTALWAVAESGLGGVLHAFRLPLTGLVVGGIAIVLLTLLAHFAERPRALLRATAVVLIVKALVSPHSPIGAYLAVGFQGGLAFLIYSLGKPGYWTSVPLAVVAMLESAIQKLLMLVLFFGQPLRDGVDGYGAWVIRRFFPGYADADVSLTAVLVGGYVGVYAVGGLLIGLFAARVSDALAAEVARTREGAPLVLARAAPPVVQPSRETKAGKRRRKRLRKLGLLVVVCLVLAASVYLGGDGRQPLRAAVVYLARTLSIVALWYFVVGPWLGRQVQRYLLGKRGRYADELDAVLRFLPLLGGMARAEYRRLAETMTGLLLLRTWLLRVLAVSLSAKLDRDAVEWVTGPVHTGKTTRLAARIAEAPADYCGVLAPVDAEGVRYLRCVVSGEQRRLTCASEAADAVAVGPYHFHKEVFAWGRGLLETHEEAYPMRTLVVDEIGKLELRGEGLAPACWEVVAARKRTGAPALVVVRETLVPEVGAQL